MTYTVYFVDDIGDATEISNPFDTYEQAQEWDNRYWEDYFERNPGSTVYFCKTEIRGS